MERHKSQEKGKSGRDHYSPSPEQVIGANMAIGTKALLFYGVVPLAANCRTKALVFFDSGSQKSYTTTRLADRLQHHKSWAISTFDDSVPQTVRSNRTVISVQLQNGTCKAAVVSIIKRITSNLEVAASNIEVHFGDLKPLQLPLKIRSPDILIGHDYFSYFVTLARIKR
uniref:DUF1758 domain-containing protein n=1 Tax=Toxocara canis TaxID=6265 RepID=A0A183UPN0_TOXCA